QNHPNLFLVLAPRKPERFDTVAAKLDDAFIGHRPPATGHSPFVRRSQLSASTTADALLLDTIGELAALFQPPDVLFLGGTLNQTGGHNILEPAYFAKPVIVGPHMENFAEIEREFSAAGALVKIDSADQLPDAVEKLLDNPGDIGAKAQRLAQSKR